MLVSLFLLILSLNLGWNDPRHWHSENSWVDSQEQDDPLVAVSSILDIPLLGLGVPGVASTDGCCNLFMRKWRQSLHLVNEAATTDSVSEHVYNDLIFNRQLLFVNVFGQLLNRNPVIKVFINGVTQVSNAIHWHLEWLVSLVKVLLGAGEVAGVRQILHTHHREL